MELCIGPWLRLLHGTCFLWDVAGGYNDSDLINPYKSHFYQCDMIDLQKYRPSGRLKVGMRIFFKYLDIHSDTSKTNTVSHKWQYDPRRTITKFVALTFETSALGSKTIEPHPLRCEIYWVCPKMVYTVI